MALQNLTTSECFISTLKMEAVSEYIEATEIYAFSIRAHVIL